MRRFAWLAPIILASGLVAADPSVAGSWIVHFDNSKDPELIPESVCLTLRGDGSFEFRVRMGAEGSDHDTTVVGEYELSGRRLTLKPRGEWKPRSELIEVDGHQLRLVPADGDPKPLELVFERTAWCDSLAP